MNSIEPNAKALLDFWFSDSTKAFWFDKKTEFDKELKQRFFLDYEKAFHNNLDWPDSPHHTLAEIILLDQIPRNIFRNTSQAFASDSLALRKANIALDKGDDTAMTLDERRFLYMPFMHSEVLDDQCKSVQLFKRLGDPLSLDFAVRHKDIIERFSRFPHRNALLNRPSTPQEKAFLSEHTGF